MIENINFPPAIIPKIIRKVVSQLIFLGAKFPISESIIA